MARAEGYIRPPIVAIEPRSRKASRRRSRIILTLLLIAVAVGVYFLARALLNEGDHGGSVGSAPSVALTVHPRGVRQTP